MEVQIGFLKDCVMVCTPQMQSEYHVTQSSLREVNFK